MEEPENKKEMIVSVILGLIIIGCGGAIQLLMICGRHELAHAIGILMGYFAIGVLIIVFYKMCRVDPPQRRDN